MKTVYEEKILITNKMIRAFANVSGDHNPIHLDDEAAKKSIFGGRIAHGMLSGALVSGILGTKCPGDGTIYKSQVIRFCAPVRPKDVVTFRITVSEVDRRNNGTIKTEGFVKGKLVFDGEAIVKMPPAWSK